MKKTLFSFLIVSVLIFLTACSSLPVLSFNNALKDSSNPSFSNETAVYEVSHNKNFSFGSSDFTAKDFGDKFVYSYSNGKLTTTLSEISRPLNVEIPNVNGDIVNDSTCKVYKLENDFSIDVDYTINGEQKQHHDTIYSLCYFLDDGSLTPFYSCTKKNETIFSVSDKVLDSQVTTDYEIFYTKDKYKIINHLTDGDQEKEYSYAYKTVIDNAQLLFSLRCADVAEKDQTTALPTVTISYNKAQSLSLRYNDNAENDRTISVNGSTPETIKLKEKIITLSLTPEKSGCEGVQTGRPQIYYVQNAVSSSLKGKRCLITKFYQSIVALGSYDTMGVLEYTLSGISIS